MEQLPITDSRDYREALSKILKDVQLWCEISKRKTWIRLPDKLLARIAVSNSPDLAYERVKAAMSYALQNYCEVGDWIRGEDTNGQYIRFSITPERIQDEV